MRYEIIGFDERSVSIFQKHKDIAVIISPDMSEAKNRNRKFILKIYCEET